MITVICLPFVQKEEGESSSFGSAGRRKGAIQTLSSLLLPVCALGRRGQTAFVASPRLLFAGSRARAVDSHLADVGALLGGESVSLSVVGHSGTVGALDGRGEVVGHGAGL